MPNGFGLTSAGGLPRSELAALASTGPAGSSARLATVAVTAVRRLAAASGHALPAAALMSAANVGRSPASADTVALIMFVAGAVLIVPGLGCEPSARPCASSSGRCSASRAAALLVAVVLAVGAIPPAARADGDPGSDVLVFQDLLAGADAGLSVQQQVQFDATLKSAQRAGVPVRVAIIASPSGPWRGSPACGVTYARMPASSRFELLSLGSRQRLLVVMPNGFGFDSPATRPRRLPAAGEDSESSPAPAAAVTTTEHCVVGRMEPQRF